MTASQKAVENYSKINSNAAYNSWMSILPNALTGNVLKILNIPIAKSCIRDRKYF